MQKGFSCNSFNFLYNVLADLKSCNDSRGAPVIILDYNKNFTEYRRKFGYLYYTSPANFNFNAFINFRFKARQNTDVYIICDDLKHFKVDIDNYLNRETPARVTLYAYSRAKCKQLDFIDFTKE